MKSKTLVFLLLCVAVFPISARAQCSPFQGLGATQFSDNSGVPLTNGVLYSFQAGTTTQQASYTDATCATPNPNPITFTTGARASIWATTGATYKWVLCLQNDGPTCSPSDVLFSVDQVPGGPPAGGGGGGPPFTSSSPNPATSGVLRCASGDQCLVFRNAANSANLALTKDSNDLLSWAGGTFKLPEVSTPSSVSGFDILEADSSAHRFKQCSNGVACTQIVNSGVDVNTSDQVTQLHFGATGTPLSGTAPTTNQFLRWNGTNVVGAPTEASFGYCIANGANACGVANSFAETSGAGVGPFYGEETLFVAAHTILRLTYQQTVSGAGCSTVAVVGVRDITSSTNLTTLTISNGAANGFTDSGALSVNTTAGDKIMVGVITAAAGCAPFPQIANLVAVYE